MITGLKPGETVFEHRGAEIVPGGGGVCEEVLGDQSANAVAAEIFGSGIAISGPVEPSEGGCATGLKGSTEDVLGCGIHPVTLAGRRVLRKASLGSACLRLHILLIHPPFTPLSPLSDSLNGDLKRPTPKANS